MKLLRYFLGGRPRKNNDIFTLQDQVDVLSGFHKGRGAYIIKGCQVSGNQITSGTVVINNQICSFAGASGLTFPVYMKQSAVVDSDILSDATGENEALYSTYNAEIVTTQPTGTEYITFTSSGGRTFVDALNSQVVTTKDNQTVAGEKTFSNKAVFSSTLVSNNQLSVSSTYGILMGGNTVKGFEVGTTVGTSTSTLPSSYSVKTELNKKSDTTYVNSELTKKADKTYTDNQLSTKVATTTYNSGMATKLDITTFDGYGFKRRGEASGTTSWDTLTDAGCYKIQNFSTSAVGSPPASYRYGTLTVDRAYGDGENRITQTYIPHTTDTNIYIRMANSGSWGAWKVYADKTYLDNQVATKLSPSEAWKSVPMGSGDFGGGNMKFRKNAEGKVEFKGHILMFQDWGGVMATLPVGYRPPAVPNYGAYTGTLYHEFIVGASNTGNGFADKARIRIATDGKITPYNTSHFDMSYNMYHMDNVTYYPA